MVSKNCRNNAHPECARDTEPCLCMCHVNDAESIKTGLALRALVRRARAVEAVSA